MGISGDLKDRAQRTRVDGGAQAPCVLSCEAGRSHASAFPPACPAQGCTRSASAEQTVCAIPLQVNQAANAPTAAGAPCKRTRPSRTALPRNSGRADLVKRRDVGGYTITSTFWLDCLRQTETSGELSAAKGLDGVRGEGRTGQRATPRTRSSATRRGLHHKRMIGSCSLGRGRRKAHRTPHPFSARAANAGSSAALRAKRSRRRAQSRRAGYRTGNIRPTGGLVEQPRRRSGLRDQTHLRRQSGTDGNALAKARLGQFPLWIAGHHHRLRGVDRLCGPKCS
jgi:hypothetical protein